MILFIVGSSLIASPTIPVLDFTHTKTRDECKRVCFKSFSCKAFNYYPLEKRCELIAPPRTVTEEEKIQAEIAAREDAAPKEIE
jgi:hypothetical protein